MIAPDGKGPKAISYHLERDGEVSDAPPFDMVAANSGRVFVKEACFARFYFTMLQPMFVPRGAGVPVPSMYFKLDPEQGIPEADNRDRLDHLAVPDSLHPAAVRFPLFRHAMGLDLNDTMIVNVDKHMRTWHRIDGRPPMAGGDPPIGDVFPPVDTVVSYRSNMPFGGITCKLGYRIKKVLDIGVGHAHWHEQRCSIYGGEMDSLDGRGLPPCLEGRNAYQLFNGPVDDQGGFIDNTINYYVLAQFAEGDWRDDEAIPATAFGVLWLDEQAVLSERWRLLDPADCQFGSFKDVIPSAIVQYLDKDFWHPSFRFDRSKFWCPMRAGYVTPRSRMAVSRAVVVVSGRDPATRRWELYSINFGFGTADRTWRWRALPWLAGDARPDRFGLREDMTLYVEEDSHRDGSCYWYQKYLPACVTLTPSGEELEVQGKKEGDAAPLREVSRIAKPAQGFAHPWQCLPKDVFWFVHTHFSHFGSYESRVNWRWQYYTVKVLEGEGVLRSASESERWIESGDQLEIVHDAIDWERLNDILRNGPDAQFGADLMADLIAMAGSVPGGIAGAISGEASRMLFGTLGEARDVGAIRAALCAAYNELRDESLIRRRHRKGLFLPTFSLSLRFRKPLGWIMVHADKRDDDLLPFRGFEDSGATPLDVRLVSSERNASVRLRIEEYHKVIDAPQVSASEVAVVKAADAEPRLRVRIKPCVEKKLDENVWRIKLGWLTRNAEHELDGFEVLFDEVRADAPTQVAAGGWHTYEWSLDGRADIAKLGRACSESGRRNFGTSLWFEDVVGHVATPDSVSFE